MMTDATEGLFLGLSTFGLPALHSFIALHIHLFIIYSFAAKFAFRLLVVFYTFPVDEDRCNRGAFPRVKHLCVSRFAFIYCTSHSFIHHLFMANFHKFWYHFHHTNILSSVHQLVMIKGLHILHNVYYEAAMPKLNVCYPPKLLLVIHACMNFAEGISLIVFIFAVWTIAKEK